LKNNTFKEEIICEKNRVKKEIRKYFKIFIDK
jgi:hypothetical protein